MVSCIGIDQNEFHAEPVFDHLMYSLDAATALTDNPMLRLAAGLHDVGKPSTKSTAGDGRVHFYEHETKGASIVYEWMRAMKFSNKDVEYVTKLVRHHQWRFMDDSKDKTIRRWLRDVGDSWKDLITLRAADRKGNMAKQHKSMITQKMRDLMTRAEAIIASGAPIFDKDLAITGHDLKELGVKPGPVYKEIIQKVWALVINEPDKNTKEYLREFVQKRCINATRPTGNS
jgi:putative nucleotidyltransferase with HDIG domain